MGYMGGELVGGVTLSLGIFGIDMLFALLDEDTLVDDRDIPASCPTSPVGILSGTKAIHDQRMSFLGHIGLPERSVDERMIIREGEDEGVRSVRSS